MGVSVTLNTISSGYNRLKIDSNFQAIKTALGDSLSRSGAGTNTMNADIDMDGNDLLNVGNVVLADGTSTYIASNVNITGGVISGVTVNNSSIGATTPSTGAFTTLSATGSITGASLALTTPLPLTSGGTGSTTASGARTALGLGTMAVEAASSYEPIDADIMRSDTTKRITANIGFTPVTDSSSSGSVTFDFSTGNIVKTTLTEAITSITLSGATAGDTLKIWITQAAGSYAVSGWPASVKWANGTIPTISSTDGAVDIITLEYDGTNYYAAISQGHV